MSKRDLKTHILVVDDDDRLRNLLGRFLKENDLLVSAAKSAMEASEYLKLFAFDLIILDVMMPEINGFEFLERLRKTNNVPVLMLTAMGEVESRITGLETGADDYLSKPFEPKELLLRIRNILKRVPLKDDELEGEGGAAPALLHFGECYWNTQTEELFDGEEKVRLTPAEAALLKVLTSGVGRIFSREDIIKSGTADENNPRTIDVQITRLRSKIERDPKVPKYLQTIRGKGYILQTD